MKQSVMMLLSILCVFLLLISFPIRDLWNNAVLSDACRILGLVLLVTLAVTKLIKSKASG